MQKTPIPITKCFINDKDIFNSLGFARTKTTQEKLSQSFKVEHIQAMAAVPNFPYTSWLEAMDGTSNSGFSQSPAEATSPQARCNM